MTKLCCRELFNHGTHGACNRWYDVNVPVADRLYDEHLEQLRREGELNG
jgi:hypothetical protein